ncbi:MAG TPA: hypothetical protein VFC73_09965 [Syntrophomonadaceae bacterium]|nr:hypothetical protein [Syntrophomonadaceae bacterium]
MTFKIKLKVGYFKTELYNLAISEGNITLSPLDNKADFLFIENSELKSVGYIKRENREGELEIITSDTIYTGTLLASDSLVELYKTLSKELGNKFAFHKGVPE